ncbi:hypothetical protein [Serratia marcescens]|uniref:hypothetical protein n=1 Tax=Serratia marcescens TaxID=615 RepID=UPI0040467A37
MRRPAFTAFAMVGAMLLTGCASPNYVGVQIASTSPMSMARVWVNGNAVVLCRIGGEKKSPSD